MNKHRSHRNESSHSCTGDGCWRFKRGLNGGACDELPQVAAPGLDKAALFGKKSAFLGWFLSLPSAPATLGARLTALNSQKGRVEERRGEES